MRVDDETCIDADENGRTEESSKVGLGLVDCPASDGSRWEHQRIDGFLFLFQRRLLWAESTSIGKQDHAWLAEMMNKASGCTVQLRSRL